VILDTTTIADRKECKPSINQWMLCKLPTHQKISSSDFHFLPHRSKKN